MRKPFFIVILLFGLMTPPLAYSGSPTYAEDYSPNGTIDFSIDPLSRLCVGIAVANRGDIIYIDIVVTSGPGIVVQQGPHVKIYILMYLVVS